nr:DUF389 domain-containing protein [uncultured Desulfobacter sp.]
MTDYVRSAAFIHTADTKRFAVDLQENLCGTQITPLAFDDVVREPEKLLRGVGHVVVSGPLQTIKEVLFLSMKYDFTVGLIPMTDQKDLIKCFALPRKINLAVDLALRADAQAMDLILCNREIILFKATMGRLPLVDSPEDISRYNMLINALKRLRGLKLLQFDFTVSNQRKIRTAACGCMIIQQHEGTLASRLISHDNSFTDGMISMLVSAPRSIIEYLAFLYQTAKTGSGQRKIPDAVGYVKCPRIEIDCEKKLDVYIDGEPKIQTPVRCQTLKKAVRINVSEKLLNKRNKSRPSGTTQNVGNLPVGKELSRLKTKSIPFFSYASEERFKDLFTALRDDARINPAYLVLILLSTMLATVGLYLNSSSVIIGAMLLAPLMAPIISISMGLLRQDQFLIKYSALKIIAGVLFALTTSALICRIYPDDPTTAEMLGRLHPTLLDLSVAIISGVAGAYTKSFKEIIQSLAGVAIAVALVPPLAVAGIGIGRMDFDFFSDAFLLFSTNLIGIILAAVLTFRVLGYSSAIRAKKTFLFVILILVFISIPLSLSFYRIVDTRIYERNWQVERFLINDKYLVVRKAKIEYRGNKKILNVNVLAREPLTRKDLSLFKKKVQTHFHKTMIIRVNVIYIL